MEMMEEEGSCGDNKRRCKEEDESVPKRQRLDVEEEEDTEPITEEEKEKLFAATQDLNELICTAFNYVNAHEDCKGSRANKIVPVVCEHGTSQIELNGSIDQFRNKMMLVNNPQELNLKISHNPPFFMTEDVLTTFKNHFSDDVVDGSDDDIPFYNLDTMMLAMIPGQVRLIENIRLLMRAYYVKEDIPLYKLAEPCESLNCNAPYSVKYISCGGASDEGFPKLPKLRNPFVYKLTKDMYSNPKKAKDYLEGLNNALAHEETTQCLVCDAMYYYFNEYNNKTKKRFTLEAMPNVNHQFYKNTSNHTIKMNQNFFDDIEIQRTSDGSFQIVYKGNTIYPSFWK